MRHTFRTTYKQTPEEHVCLQFGAANIARLWRRVAVYYGCIRKPDSTQKIDTESAYLWSSSCRLVCLLESSCAETLDSFRLSSILLNLNYALKLLSAITKISGSDLQMKRRESPQAQYCKEDNHLHHWEREGTALMTSACSFTWFGNIIKNLSQESRAYWSYRPAGRLPSRLGAPWPSGSIIWGPSKV